MKKPFPRKLTAGADLLLFTLPALVSVALVTLIPFVMNMYYSLYEWNGISRNKTFIGLQNFIRIFAADKGFRSSLVFTFRFTVFFVIAVNVLAIVIAYALVSNKKAAYVFRSFYFTPYIISLVAISLIWKCVLGPGFNYLFEVTEWSFFGLSWLGAPKEAFYTVIFVAIWQNIGYYMVVYIAGFTGIAADVLEAAGVDGATGLTKFFKIQLPLLMPSITICAFTSLTYSFKLFDIVLVLTKGGPASATTSIAYNIYNEAFISSNYGLATAKSLVFFVLVLTVTIIQLKFFKSREVGY